ncbi:MAG: HAMP domain-containing protein, partial [Rhodocyclaceae bacterium]|nr:HAMP domain-containing protein [Rhodocyclaceae bacterium]
MFEALKGITFSLRFRLIAAACAALVLGLWMLAANSVRLLDEALLARENRHLAELQALYSASLAVPLAERDHARLTRLVAQLGQQTGTRYFVLTDAARRVVAAEGWDPLAPLPPAMQDFALLPREATRFDGMVTLRLGEREVGSAHFGIDTQFLRQASANLLWQSTAIGWAALLLTAVLLAFVSYWLTRNLRVLQQGVAALEGGATDVRLPAGGNDEIGRLTRAFNRMSQALDERVEALKKSEARFHAIADYTYGVEAWFNPRGRLIWINRSV